MRIFNELRYTVIVEIVWTFYLKSVPAKFQKYSTHISWVISGSSSSNCRATLVIPSGTSVAIIVSICCNHRDGEYFLHWITRKLGSTAASTVITRLLHLTNYISGAENETLRALLGHTKGNIKCTHRRPRPCWPLLQLQTLCGSPQWRYSNSKWADFQIKYDANVTL